VIVCIVCLYCSHPSCLFSPSSEIDGSPRMDCGGVTAGLAESNGSLLPGLWLTSPAGWLPSTGISSRTLHSVIEYGLPLPFSVLINCISVYCKLIVCSLATMIVLRLCSVYLVIGSDSASIQFAISNVSVNIFSTKMYRSNFNKQQSETVVVWNYKNADCSLRKKFHCVIYCNFRHSFVPYWHIIKWRWWWLFSRSHQVAQRFLLCSVIIHLNVWNLGSLECGTLNSTVALEWNWELVLLTCWCYWTQFKLELDKT